MSWQVAERNDHRVARAIHEGEELDTTYGLDEVGLLDGFMHFVEGVGIFPLKGRPLSVTPTYLQRDDHATGLIRLLSIGLRVLTLLEFVVRRRLAVEGTALAGLYAGNAKRVTARPTAERLLEAFQEITLTIIQEVHQVRRHLTPLSELQLRILALLDFPLGIYTRLCANSSEPP